MHRSGPVAWLLFGQKLETRQLAGVAPFAAGANLALKALQW